MDHVLGHAGVLVVLDLGAEDAAQAQQQAGVVGHGFHAGQAQQAVALAQGVRQGAGVGLGGQHERLGAGLPGQTKCPAKDGTR